MGERTKLKAQALALIDRKRDAMLERAAGDEFVELFFDGLKARMSKGARCGACRQSGLPKRDALVLYAQILKLVDSAPQIQVAIAQFLGVQPDVAKARVEMVAEVEELDEHEKFIVCRDYVVTACEKDGKLVTELKPLMRLFPDAEVA